jgi:hypothetical protein
MIVATGTFVPAEKMLFEHRRNGLMEPYEATLAKISFTNDNPSAVISWKRNDSAVGFAQILLG